MTPISEMDKVRANLADAFAMVECYDRVVHIVMMDPRSFSIIKEDEIVNKCFLPPKGAIGYTLWNAIAVEDKGLHPYHVVMMCNHQTIFRHCPNNENGCDISECIAKEILES